MEQTDFVKTILSLIKAFANKKRNIISLVLKALLATVSLNGVLLSFLQGGSFSWRIFLFFTIHCNSSHVFISQDFNLSSHFKIELLLKKSNNTPSQNRSALTAPIISASTH